MSRKENKKNSKKEKIEDNTELQTEQEETTLETETQAEPDPMQVLVNQNEELKNDLLRKVAEFDNFKKRTAKEKEDVYTFAKASCAESFLSVLDNFERALQTQCADEEFKKGVDMIFVQLDESLKKLGLEEIEALNQPFNPELHNAVNQIQDENFGENIVCQVFQKGYKIGDKVVRHSMVVVANP